MLIIFYSLNNQVKSVKLQKFSPEFALLFTSLYGLSDEAHQYFVPNRSCEFYDWIADVAGGLAVYFVIKYHRSRVKVISVLFLAVILGGCTSSENAEQKSKIDISFSETDCWLNLMPMVNDNKNVLGFLLSLNVEANSSDLNYSVKDLKIYLNNDTLLNKELSVEIFEASENLIKINISQNNRTIYLDRNKEYPAEAEFHFAIYKDNKKSDQ
ncbi:MAG: VanZ family protein [Ignavibacteria bacterium]|nr:VanZ family protein [Ignavibacteria bacterium]